MEKEKTMTAYHYFSEQTQIRFLENPSKQRILIKFLTRHSGVTTAQLADLLAVSSETLGHVCEQKEYLQCDKAEKLIELFCMWCAS